MTWDVSAPPWVTKGTYCIGEVDSDIAIAQTFICGGEERNAHLIAAAPELYEAAKKTLRQWDDPDGGFVRQWLEEAIEKAEGNQ